MREDVVCLEGTFRQEGKQMPGNFAMLRANQKEAREKNQIPLKNSEQHKRRKKGKK